MNRVNRRSSAFWNPALGAVVILLVAGALYVVVGALNLRMDLTEERLYTLSPGTRSLLQTLPRSAQLKLYATRGEAMPIPLRQYARRVEDFLREYVRLSRGRLTLEVYDPKPDSDEEEWARKYGIEGRTLDILGEGPAVYLGLAVVSGTKEASIPFLSPDQEPRLEYEITRLLLEVTRTKKPRVGLLSSLDLLGLSREAFRGRSAPAWTFAKELQSLYEVVTIGKDDTKLPEDLSALVIVHPKELEQELLYAVDQYVVKGGRVLIFVDPLCLADMELQGPTGSPFGFAGASSNLNKLTEAWGYVMNPMLVVDPLAATFVRTGGGPPVRNAAWLTLRDMALEPGEIATSGLSLLMLPFAGAFSGTAASGLTATTLVKASDLAGLTDPIAASFGGDLTQNLKPDPTARVLAVRLAGRFRSAFPDGPPGAKPREATKDAAQTHDGSTPGEERSETATEGGTASPEESRSAENQTAESRSADGHVKEGTSTGIVILVGDVDLLYDRFAIDRVQFFGYEVAQLANDNLNFAWNLVEQLVGGETMISLRSRGRFDRPFHRVQEIERRALEQWRAEEERLMEQLRQTRERLAELRRNRDPSQQVIITEEQRKEIERFREQQFETERQLKEVRKQRRRDIERLGMMVKTVNLVAVPLAVAIFGVVRGIRRRRAGGG